MNGGKKALISTVGIVFTCATAWAITADNPYQGIVDRNVFGLRAPPPPPDPNEVNKPQPPKITPTGLTTILGNKRVLFKVQQPARPPEPAKEQSFIMTEGQREGQIEVLEIDEKAGSIKFNNYGTVVTLTLEKDGPKQSNTPPPGGVGAVGAYGVPQQHANNLAVPAGGAGTVTTFGGSSSAGLQNIPQRSIRSAGSMTPGQPGFSGGIAAPGGYQTQIPQQQQQLSREEQVLMMEIERERTKQHVASGDLPPLPPTELTPGGASPTAPAPVTQQPNAPNLPPLPPGTPPRFPQ
jgi:hypothetical protein